MSVQNFQQNPGVLDRLRSEFDAWNLNFDLQELATSFHFDFHSVKIFGVQWEWEPEEFLQKACEVGHPLSPALALPPELAYCIESIAKLGVVAIAKERLEF